MDIPELKKSFAEAHLKVDRAARHLWEAETHFQRYIQSDCCRLIEKVEQNGNINLSVEADNPPDEISLCIGDAFHNLSSALDYVMSGLMRAHRLSNRRITFPSEKTRTSLRQKLKTHKEYRSILQKMPSFVLLLLMKIKPYAGGPYNVWEIRQLDNIDKHNLICPTMTIGSLENISFALAETNTMVIGHTVDFPTGERFPLARHIPGWNSPFFMDRGTPRAEMTFPAAGVFAGRNVFSTLLTCIRLTSSVIAAVEELAARSPTASRPRACGSAR